MPNPDDLWKKLADERDDEEAIESAASASVAEAERDLAAAGFDVKAERARAEALIAELLGEAAAETTAWVSGPPPAGQRPPASRKVVWLVAALVAAATAGGIFYAASHYPPPPDKPEQVPSATVSAAPPSLPVAPSEAPPRRVNPAGPLDPKTPP